MAEAIALRLQVPQVPHVWRGGDGDDVFHLEAVLSETDLFPPVVGEEPDGPDAEGAEDGRGLAVVPSVHRKAQSTVGVQRVNAVLLEHVRAKLVDQSDPSALLAGRVYENSSALSGDGSKTGAKLWSTVAPERAQGITGQAFGVKPNEDRAAVADLAAHHRHVDESRRGFECVHVELTGWGGDGDSRHVAWVGDRSLCNQHDSRPSQAARCTNCLQADRWGRREAMRIRMARAVRFTGPRTIEIADVELPEPAAGQLAVRTLYSGVSGGTEMLAYRGEIDPRTPLDEKLDALSGTFSYPFAYGYSCVGRVEASVAEHPEGTLVFGFHPHQDLFVIDAGDAISAEGTDPRVATLLPLVETALQASTDAGAQIGDVVVVQGLGVVGILIGALLGRAGIVVIGSDPLAWRRKTATHFGVRAVMPEEARDATLEASDGRGAAIVVEATGNPDALADGLGMLRQEGTALVASWYGTKKVTLPLGEHFHRRRLTIRSTQVSSIPAAQRARWDRKSRLESARALLDELPLHLLATHEFPFDRAAEAYAAIDRGEEGLIHAALSYR